MENISSPPASWYNPPEYHEVCKCEDCHVSGEHEGYAKEFSKQGCAGCYEVLNGAEDIFN